MKKKLAIAVLAMVFAGNAHASFSIFEWGNNKHNNHRNRSHIQGTTQEPVSVPEPSTMILLGSGLVALISYKRKEK
jgi:ABC-type proline/glycine betaine transport system ATPase subunit